MSYQMFIDGYDNKYYHDNSCNTETSNIMYSIKCVPYHPHRRDLLKYIKSHGSELDPTYRDDRDPYGNITPLILALYAKCDNEILLALIATGNSNIGASNYNGETALTRALRTFYNDDNDISSEVIIAMIETGEAIPFAIGTKTNNILLKFVCKCNWSDIALTLIDKYDSSLKIEPPPRSWYGWFDEKTENTALDYARLNKMYDVQFVLNKLIAIERRNPAIIAMYIHEYP